METHRRRLAVVAAGAALVCAIVGGGLASAQSVRSVAAAPFHAPVGFDRASGVRTSLVQKAPADVLVLPAAQVAAADELEEAFDDITLLPGAGWALTNNSAPVGPSSWFQGNQTIFPAHEGAPAGYIAANYESAGDAGTISNWLITPEVTIVNGTELRFWTRKGPQFEAFFDRLEVRLSVAGASVDVGATADSVGDFTDVLLTINEPLGPGQYPEEWTEYVLTVQGRSRAPVTGRFAFRYWVTDTASNGDYIGIDTVTVTQPGDGGTACANPVEAIEEGFDDIAQLPGACWALINNSEPLGTRSWHQGFVFPAHEGAPEAYIAVGWESTGEQGTSSAWLLTPEVSLENGTELRFWTRENAGVTPPDRLEVRMSTAGASTNVGDTAESVGDFTALLLSVNPNLEQGGYPEGWTEFVVTVSGLDAPASGRLAFRYFVTDAAVNGLGIGIDTVTVTQPGGGGGPATLTHSESMDIQEGRGPACQPYFDDTTAVAQYLRTFTLTDFDITGTFNVTEVTFGIERAFLRLHNVTVNLYTLDGTFTYDNLTLIGSASVQPGFGTTTQELITVPVTGEAPAGSTLVVEIVAPDVTYTGGEFFPAANDLGETAPSYFAADACGIPNPITFADYGFPNSHLVMTVTGVTGDGAASSVSSSQPRVNLTSRVRSLTRRIGGLIRSPGRSWRP